MKKLAPAFISLLNLFTASCQTNFVPDSVVSVSALKPEEMPEVRMETKERQSAGYEVYHQKLV